ncbi:Hypothetical protein PENO1_008040 [Penicillium occitanis (nom. inval.)]|nr:Hypothetical protein PENO1_008040 [Penicillium occitanis (nom. inval.)]PCH10065.1 hypothetical protein PENOC_004680 [Penicillium occitanis (nom. inval.)]
MLDKELARCIPQFYKILFGLADMQKKAWQQDDAQDAADHQPIQAYLDHLPALRCTMMLRLKSPSGKDVGRTFARNIGPWETSVSAAPVYYASAQIARSTEEDGTCRRVEEEKARKEEKWKRDMEMLEDILERKIANEVAEFAGEFLDLISDGMRTNLLSDFQRSLEQMSALSQGNLVHDPLATAPHPLLRLQQQLPQAGLLQTHDEGDVEHDQFPFDQNNSDEDMINDEAITPIAD